MSETTGGGTTGRGTTGGARDRILAKVRAALDVRGGAVDPRRPIVDARIANRRRHLIPKRARRPAAELRQQFKDILERGKAQVIEVASDAMVPEALATYLRDRNLPGRVRTGADARIGAMPWSSVPSLDVSRGRADPTDTAAVSRALAAAAETGTLMLASGPDNPVTLTFLPDTHFVVLDAGMLAGSYEDAFDSVRATLGPGVMPRTLNLVSGPSRTSDIGGKTVMGAHGPRRLAVFLVG